MFRAVLHSLSGDAGVINASCLGAGMADRFASSSFSSYNLLDKKSAVLRLSGTHVGQIIAQICIAFTPLVLETSGAVPPQCEIPRDPM